MDTGKIEFNETCDYLVAYRFIMDNTINTISVNKMDFISSYNHMSSHPEEYEILGVYIRLSNSVTQSIFEGRFNHSNSMTSEREKSFEDLYRRQHAVIAEIVTERVEMKNKLISCIKELEKIKDENEVLRTAVNLTSEDLSMFKDGVKSIDKLLTAMKTYVSIYGETKDSDTK